MALMAHEFHWTLVALLANAQMDLLDSICRMASLRGPWICHFSILPGLVHNASFLDLDSRLDCL